MADKSKSKEPEGGKQLDKITKKTAAKGGANGGKKGGASSHGIGKAGRTPRGS